MARLSDMPAPTLPLSGLELVPALEGGGVDGNVAIPLLAYGQLPRGAVLKLRVPMLADLSATSDADPGAGKVRWNNAAPGSATMLYVDDVDVDAADVSAALAALTVGGFVYLQASNDSDRRDTWQKWQVASITDASGYTKVGVSLQAYAGTFVADEPIELTIQQPSPAPGVDRNVVSTLSSSAGVVTVDCSLGDYFKLTPTEAVTDWTFTNVPAGCAVVIVLTQGATPYAVAMPSGLKWVGGTAGAFSTAASKVDELSLSTVNAGGTWRAVLGKDFA